MAQKTLLALLIVSSLLVGGHAPAQQTNQLDGVLDFWAEGVSEVEFLVGDRLGIITTDVTWADGRNFEIGDGFCQIAAMINAELISSMSVAVNSRGYWVMGMSRIIDLDDPQIEADPPAIGVQCFLN